MPAPTSFSYPPGYEIGYDQITATVNITSTTESTGTTIITCAAHAFDGGPVLVQFFAPSVKGDNNAAGDFTIISLFEGATQITRLGLVEELATFAPDNYVLTTLYRFTPSGGLHTYTVTASVSANANAQVIAGSGGTAGYPPAFIRFTKV